MPMSFQSKEKPNLGSVQVRLENGVNLLEPNYLYTPVRLSLCICPMLAPGKMALTMRKLQTEPFDLAPVPTQSDQGCQISGLAKMPYEDNLVFQCSGIRCQETRIDFGLFFEYVPRGMPDLGDPKDQGSSLSFSKPPSALASKILRFFELVVLNRTTPKFMSA